MTGFLVAFIEQIVIPIHLRSIMLLKAYFCSLKAKLWKETSCIVLTELLNVAFFNWWQSASQKLPPLTKGQLPCDKKYIEICERVKEDKENIHPFFNTKIHEWKLALTSLFYLCSTETEYLRYGRRLKEFNIVFDLVLKEGTALIYQPNNET